MHFHFQALKKRLSSSLITTAVALIVLSIVALFFHGTVICISTVFETFLVSIIIQLFSALIDSIEIPNIRLEILCRYASIITTTVCGGYLFHWVDQLPVPLLAGMGLIAYFFCYLVELDKTKTDIDKINEYMD